MKEARTRPLVLVSLLSGTLLLASCGGGSTTPKPQPEPKPQPTSGNPRVIVGNIDPNKDLPTSVTVPLLDEKAVRASVDSQGKFTLTLPATLQDSDLLTAGDTFGLDCSASKAVNAPAGNLLFPVRYVRGNNGNEYFNKTDSGAANTASVKRMRIYAKRDARIVVTPTATCRVSADLNLKAGWNVVEETLPVSGNAVYKNTTLPAGPLVFRDTKLYAGSLGAN